MNKADITVDQRLLKTILTQVTTETLGIDPAVVMLGAHQSDTASGRYITISSEQLVTWLDKLLELLSSVLMGAMVLGGGGGHNLEQILLSEAIRELIEATQAEGKRQTTCKWYQDKLSRFLEFVGDRHITTIEASDIRTFLAALYQRGDLSENYVEGFVRAIRRLFNWCEAEEYLEKNPMRRIRTRSRGDPPIKCVLWTDVERLLETTLSGTPVDLRDRAIKLLLYDTGCRVSALCKLCCDQVDVENGLVWLNEKKNEKAYGRPISQPTREALRAWLEARPETSTESLFVSVGSNTKGQALTPTGVSQMLKRRAQQAGVKGHVNPHSFRHAFARDYILSGGDLATLSQLMGHSSILVTKKYYARFNVKELQEKHARHSPVAWRLGCLPD